MPVPAEGHRRSAFSVLGEALIDVVHRGADVPATEAPGGSPANVALALGRLGHNVTLNTAWGDDVRGYVLDTWLRAAGVVSRVTPLDRTSVAIARLAEDGSAEYEFDIVWDIDPGTPSPDVHHVHVGSIATWLAPGADAVAKYVRSSRSFATVSFDPNIRPALVTDDRAVHDRCAELVRDSDLVKLSDEDLAWLHCSRDEGAVIEEWLSTGPSVVVVTAGVDGARAYAKGVEIAVPARAAVVLDTIGAGDTFMGALLGSLSDRGYLGRGARHDIASISARDLRTAIERAADASAVTVSRAGMDPPYAGELVR
ncbi:PfkB family carbohydrate kinase [Microbacterium maritypicum]